MHNPLTKEQIEKIDRRYRKCGWTIKKIARDLHISDKRVSAYLRGELKAESCKPSKPCIGGCHKKTNNKVSPFVAAVATAVKNYEDASIACTDVIYKTILTELIDVFSCTKYKSKKEIEKKMNRRLNELNEAIMRVTYEAAAAAILTMPPTFKKMFIENLDKNPSDEVKKIKK